MTQGFVHKVVAVDSNFLIAYLAPKDISPEVFAKVTYLIQQIEKAKAKIIIPMPAIAEFLVGADEAGIDALNALDRKSYVQIAPFDVPAAFECALIDRAALGAGDKRNGSTDPWQKIKVDRQIVAISRVHRATLIISNDGGVCSNATRVGIKSMKIDELETPSESKQVAMNFEPVKVDSDKNLNDTNQVLDEQAGSTDVELN